MIKKILIIVVFVSFYGKIWGQNLVPNGGFEQYITCPTALSQINSALFWFNPALLPLGGSPDYYNQCANPSQVGVPNNVVGYQMAHSGNAYSGIIVFIMFNTGREYIEVPLTSALVGNVCYYFEMHVNLGNTCKYTTDDIAVYFSDTAITGLTNWDPLPFIPQINNLTGNVFDTLHWTLVNGNYIANGGESHLIIGNFKNDINTDTILMNGNNTSIYLYLYIDDVSLTPCATGINETANTNTAFSIYPNPAEEELTVSSAQWANNKTEIAIKDISGRTVLPIAHCQLPIDINISHLQAGIYFIEINGQRKKFVKK